MPNNGVGLLQRTSSAGVEVSGVHKSFDGVGVLHDVSMGVSAGSLLALLGPSGCGKTTLLRIVAGLESPDVGTVRLGDRTLSDHRTEVPPEKRRVGLVFQDWALFPHLSVARNVAYGLGRGPERAARAERALEMVGLGGLGERTPGTLSGGQQQRVALARAIAPEPSVLLLDEPFSNLDTSLRATIRGEVHELLVSLGITTIIVTHDQEEAFVLGDEVAVMSQGRIVQQATPAELYRHPATPWVADFVGDANLLDGFGRGMVAQTAVGEVPLEQRAEGPLQVLVRPEECRVRQGGDARVELVEFYGHDTVHVVYLADGTRLRIREGSAPTASRGDNVSVTYTGGPAVAYLAERTAEVVQDSAADVALAQH